MDEPAGADVSVQVLRLKYDFVLVRNYQYINAPKVKKCWDVK